jgi:hypothetical protein
MNREVKQGNAHHPVHGPCEAVDADLAQVAAEGLDQPGGQVGAERPGKLEAVAQEDGQRPSSWLASALRLDGLGSRGR